MPGQEGNELAALLLLLLISALPLHGLADTSCEPAILNPKSSLSLPLGSTLLLNCTIQMCPDDSDSLIVTWGRMLSGKYMSINASQTAGYHWRREDTLEVVTLKIPGLAPEDEGQYQCRALQSKILAVGHIISVHLRNATEMDSSQAGIDIPLLGLGVQPSDPLLITAGILGTALLLLVLSSLLWRFCLKDLLGARPSAWLRILQNDCHCDKVKGEEEVTYTTVTFLQKPWPAGAFVHTSDTQGSSEYAILGHQCTPLLPDPRTTIANSNLYSSVEPRHCKAWGSSEVQGAG